MNVDIGTETPIFLFWEYLFRNFGVLSLQCRLAETIPGTLKSLKIIIFSMSNELRETPLREMLNA